MDFILFASPLTVHIILSMYHLRQKPKLENETTWTTSDFWLKTNKNTSTVQFKKTGPITDLITLPDLFILIIWVVVVMIDPCVSQITLPHQSDQYWWHWPSPPPKIRGGGSDKYIFCNDLIWWYAVVTWSEDNPRINISPRNTSEMIHFAVPCPTYGCLAAVGERCRCSHLSSDLD